MAGDNPPLCSPLGPALLAGGGVKRRMSPERTGYGDGGQTRDFI
jgi:hypothetical protein